MKVGTIPFLLGVALVAGAACASTGSSSTRPAQWPRSKLLQVVPAGGEEVPWYNSAPQSGRTGLEEAEHCDEKRGMTIEASEGGGEQLGGVTDAAWARYENVDFTASAPTGFRARAAVDTPPEELSRSTSTVSTGR